jgi:hypothetical protein
MTVQLDVQKQEDDVQPQAAMRPSPLTDGNCQQPDAYTAQYTQQEFSNMHTSAHPFMNLPVVLVDE